MDSFDIINQAYLLKRTQDMLFKSLLQQYGLRQSELDVLLCLHTNPDCRTASAVSECRMLPKSLISASIVTLTSRGLVECCGDSSDRRRVLLSLTPDAMPIIEQASRMTHELCGRLTDGLQEDEIAVIERALALMSGNLKAISMSHSGERSQ